MVALTWLTASAAVIAAKTLLCVVPAAQASGSTYVDISAESLPQASLADRSMDVEFADVDNDGDLDVFVAKEFAPNLLLLNNGSFRFSVAVGAIPARNEDSEDVIPGDFDGDGDIDVIFVSEDTAVNEYYLNDGTGRFSASPNAIPQNTQSNAGIAGDLDRDGDLDVVLASNVGPERVLLNRGNGVFDDVTSTWMPTVIDVTQDVELADVDGDGDLDLLVGNEPAAGGRNRLYILQQQRFVDESKARIPLRARREETREVAFGDMDADGDLDLVFGNVDFQNPSQAGNRVLINDGSGHFQDETATRLPDIRTATLDVDLSDVDGDRDLDLLVASFGVGMSVYRNDGNGQFNEATADVLGNAAAARNVIDLELIAANNARYLYEAGFNVVDRLLKQDTDVVFKSGFEPNTRDSTVVTSGNQTPSTEPAHLRQ